MKEYRQMDKWSDTGENVLWQVQIIQIQHTYVISSQKIKKIEFFGSTLLRHFLFKKSNFLRIFKNVLTGFYCTFSLERLSSVLTLPFSGYQCVFLRLKGHQNVKLIYFLHLVLEVENPLDFASTFLITVWSHAPIKTRFVCTWHRVKQTVSKRIKF
jgi:hypothetical protein